MGGDIGRGNTLLRDMTTSSPGSERIRGDFSAFFEELDANNALKRKRINEKIEDGKDLEIGEIMFLVNLLEEGHIEELRPEEILVIKDRIRDNYPMHSILALEEGEVVYDFVFDGIKEANDSLGMEFVDVLISNFKKILISSGNYSVIWSDYKNLLVRAEDNSQLENKTDFSDEMKMAFDRAVEMTNKNKGKDNPIVCHFGSETIQEAKTQKDLVMQIANFKQAINKQAAREAGNEFVELDDIPRLEESFLEEYRSDCSRDCKAYNVDGKLEKNWTIRGKAVFDEKNIFLGEIRGKNILDDSTGEKLGTISGKPVYDDNGEQVGEIMFGFYYQNFTTTGRDGEEFKRQEKIKLFDLDGTISGELIKYLRQKELTKNTEFARDLKKLVNSYELNGKFLMPSGKDPKKLESEGIIIPEKELEQFSNMLEALDNYKTQTIGEKVGGILDGDTNNLDFEELKHNILYNYKGFLDKKAFIYLVGRKQGILGFTDIKSMYKSNMLNFKSDINYYNNETEKTQEDAERVLLYSGDGVTIPLWRAIDNARKELKQKYGKNVFIGLSGDEIWHFVEGQEIDNSDIHKNFRNNLAKNGLSGRMQMTKIDRINAGNVAKKLDQLDKGTTYSKALEKRLSSLEKTLGESTSSSKKKKAVYVLSDFRIETSFKVSLDGDDHLYSLYEEDVEYHIIFDQRPFRGDNKFYVEDVFKIKTDEETKQEEVVEDEQKEKDLVVQLREKSPIIKAIDQYQLGRTG